jgi:hypothetical protein
MNENIVITVRTLYDLILFLLTEVRYGFSLFPFSFILAFSFYSLKEIECEVVG